jgi:phage protein D
VKITNGFRVEVEGRPLPADVEPLLASGFVDDSLHLPDLFVLRFRDPDHLVLPKGGFKIGAKVKLSVDTGASTPQPLMTGEVTAVEAEFDSTGTFTIVRGFDHAHRLFRGRRTYSYKQVTASDIVSTVAQRASLKIGKVESTKTVYEHVTQGGVSDWRFLSDLAREIGFEVAVRDGELHFSAPRPAADAPERGGRPATDPLVLNLGTDLLRVHATVTSAQQVGSVQVRGWDVAQKRALVATVPARTTSATVSGGVTPAGLAGLFGNPVYVTGDVPYRTQAEVEAAADALAEQVAGGFAGLEALARGNPALRAGAAIAVDNMGQPFDGKYTITSSRHQYDALSGYTTALTVSGRQERSLYGLTSGAAGGSGSPGVVVATVTDTNDPERQGRVKVSFPWLSDDYVSDWARTVQPGAGKDRGWMVLPEVGDEVLVAFEQGELRRPYVLGGLYNGQDTPNAGGIPLVDGSSGAVNRRSMISRKGHRIDLQDEDGKTEGITLTSTGDKVQLVLDHTGTKVTVHSDGTVLIEGKQGVVVDAGSSTLDLKGTDIKLTAKSGVTIDGGTGAVKVTTNGQLSLSGLQATLDGKTKAEVKGGALASVSAALVKIN